MYSDEAELQKIVYERPDLLKSEQQSADIYSIDREVTVPSGRIDVLDIDKNGTVLIIEVKLNKNLQLRREVLGQLLDYYSDIQGLSYYELNSLTNRKLENIIKKGEFEEETREKIEYNLKNDGIKLMIVTDESNDNLEKILAADKNNIDLIVIQKDDDGKVRSSRGTKRINPKPSGGKPPRPPNYDGNLKELAEVEEYWNKHYPHKTNPTYNGEVNNKGEGNRHHPINFWGSFPHYEFLDHGKEQKIGVEFHIEKAKYKYPNLYQELKQFQLTLPQEIEFSTDRSGSLRILFPYGTPKETICEGMDKLIKLTKDFIDKRMV